MKVKCPWCGRADLPIYALKRHIKYCLSAPRPRGRLRREREGRLMKISDFKRFEKNTLRAFFTVELASGMVIHKCTLHEKNGSRWIGLPAEKYTKPGGAIAYSVLIEFTCRQVADNFRRQVLLALEAAGLA
jgi:hypothetical protein